MLVIYVLIVFILASLLINILLYFCLIRGKKSPPVGGELIFGKPVKKGVKNNVTKANRNR
jgi:hypothetical protein